MKNDALGDRMKKYEGITRDHLVPRMPVIIRLDGKAFHSFTRGFAKPFDHIMMKSMQETMKLLCENIQGCVLGYTQSDEISLVLVDYQNLNSCSWFDNNIQKIASVSASMATLYFNKAFLKNVREYESIFAYPDYGIEDETDYRSEAYRKAISKGALFDSRVFNIPKEEVTNCILWRQNDATRNSIEAVGQAHFSQSQLHGKSCNQIQDMLMTEKGINWNDFRADEKRGSCCIRVIDGDTGRGKWTIDTNIPVFKGEGRAYIDDLVYVGD